MSINRVTITGNLTRDMEIRQTQNGFSVGSFCVAVNDRRKNPQTEQWEDYANFINCTLFGKRAEALEPYMTKGQKVGIDGKLEYQQWKTNEGENRSALKVIVNDLELLGGSRQQEQEQQEQGETAELFDDDCPF